MKWITDRLPRGGVVVIALYVGRWPGRGMGGVTDLYVWDDQWCNVPEGVTIVGWVPMPNDL